MHRPNAHAPVGDFHVPAGEVAGDSAAAVAGFVGVGLPADVGGVEDVAKVRDELAVGAPAGTVQLDHQTVMDERNVVGSLRLRPQRVGSQWWCPR